MKLITEELLDRVTDQAKENSRLRMNYNFHESMEAAIHRMLNALEPGTYLPLIAIKTRIRKKFTWFYEGAYWLFYLMMRVM